MLPPIEPFADDRPSPPEVWYGVWLPGKGWWKRLDTDERPKVFATQSRDMARQQAKWMGGRVYLIDESLKDFEGQMLLAEKERKARRINWHGLFRRDK